MTDHTFQPPVGFSLHPKTRIGPVSLNTASLAAQVPFYQQALGLQVRGQQGSAITLGTAVQDLLELVENPSAPRHQGSTGLYHLALLYPNRRELARAVGRLYAQQIPNSPTDHIMTKTTYLQDLEGNGLELYCESPEDGAWTLKDGEYLTYWADGTLSSGREPLDVEALFSHLQSNDSLDGAAPDALCIGHVHLHISDLDQALDFYHRLLGFDLMGQDKSLGMAFVSAGGYHHHIGLNTWQGKGAPPPPESSLGLRHFTVLLPDKRALDLVQSRMDQVGLHYTESRGGLLLSDPSQNGVLLTSED